MNLFAPLAERTYRRLFTAQILSLMGTGLTGMALALLAYELAGANAGSVLGTALAIKMIAYVGIAPIVGAYADRIPRRSFLVALDLIRAAIVLCLPFVTQIWQIYVLIFLLQACSAAFTPTFQATIPDILPDEARYTQTLSLSRLAYDMEALVSPALAAMLLTVMSYSNLFASDAVTFVVSALLILSVALPAAKPAARSGGVFAKPFHGMRIYLATPRLRGLLALNLAAAAAGAMVIVNTVIHVRGALNGSERDVAQLMMAYGFGSMAGALMLPRILKKVSDRTAMLAGAALLAAGLLIASAGPDYLLSILLWMGLGFGSSLVQTPGGRLLRRSSHAEDRPALFAAQFSLSHACWLITYPLAGWAGAHFGLAPTFLVMMSLAVAGAAAAAWLWLAHDPEEIEHAHDVVDHAHSGGHDGLHTPDNQASTPILPSKPMHRHAPMRHKHHFVIDEHHHSWPRPSPANTAQ